MPPESDKWHLGTVEGIPPCLEMQSEEIDLRETKVQSDIETSGFLTRRHAVRPRQLALYTLLAAATAPVWIRALRRIDHIFEDSSTRGKKVV